MRVRIVSDGSPRGTRVEISDDSAPIPTWRPLPGVQAIDWHLEAGHGEKAAAKITLRGVHVEIEADAEVATEESPALREAQETLERAEANLRAGASETEPPLKRLFERTDAGE